MEIPSRLRSARASSALFESNIVWIRLSSVRVISVCLRIAEVCAMQRWESSPDGGLFDYLIDGCAISHLRVIGCTPVQQSGSVRSLLLSMTNEKVILLIEAKIQPQRRADLVDAARQ